MTTRFRIGIAIAALVAAAGADSAGGQGHAGHAHMSDTSGEPRPPRITMEALHAAGGVPPGWRFSLPAGDPAAGRQAFVDLKCHACHAIRGEQFPLNPGESATAGPDLSGMGAHHPTAYLVESILNPNAVLVEGPGYIGGDGRSIMPSYPEMTAAQLVNLIAYIKSRGGETAAHAHGGAREQIAGGYRVRLVYDAPGAQDGHEGHAHHHQMTGSSAARPRLIAFIGDATSGQPVAYLPVSARIDAPGKPARTVTLAPAIGEQGPQYAADVTLAPETSRVTVRIGRPTVPLGPGAPAQLARPQTATFEWK